MTQKEYKDEIASLKAKIAQLENALIEEEKAAPPHPRWKPELGYYYYCVEPNSVSLVSFYYCDEDRTALLEGDVDIGNVFRTREDAEFAAERLKVLAEMREWAGNVFDDYAIALGHDTNIKVVPRREWCSLGEMRFATEEDAKNCINTVGEDRIIKYYFMITEDEDDG